VVLGEEDEVAARRPLHRLHAVGEEGELLRPAAPCWVLPHLVHLGHRGQVGDVVGVGGIGGSGSGADVQVTLHAVMPGAMKHWRQGGRRALGGRWGRKCQQQGQGSESHQASGKAVMIAAGRWFCVPRRGYTMWAEPPRPSIPLRTGPEAPMKKRMLFPLFALPFLCLPLTADTVIEEIVVRINNDIITRAELQQSRETVRNELKQKYGAQADQMFATQE